MNMINRTVDIECEEARYRTPAYVLPLASLPVIATTYVMQPAVIFYHLLISGAVVLGLKAALWWRRRLAAQFIFGSTAIILLPLVAPSVTAAVDWLEQIPDAKTSPRDLTAQASLALAHRNVERAGRATPRC